MRTCSKFSYQKSTKIPKVYWKFLKLIQRNPQNLSSKWKLKWNLLIFKPNLKYDEKMTLFRNSISETQTLSQTWLNQTQLNVYQSPIKPIKFVFFLSTKSNHDNFLYFSIYEWKKINKIKKLKIEGWRFH